MRLDGLYSSETRVEGVIGIVVSRADSASVHIGEQLLDLEDWTEAHVADADGTSTEIDTETVYRLPDAELREFDDLHLDLDGVDEAFTDIDLLVFASRHAGESGPLLTAHPTGNFANAEFGGQDHSLARAAPNAHAATLASLTEHAPEAYAVGLEGTHHGPTEIDIPSLFVELGSDEPQWNDPDGARAVAQAILDLRGVPPTRDRALVGFGGGHYVPRFERVVRETDWTVGHIDVDWTLDAMGDPDEHRALIDQAFEQSGAEYALIDGDRPALERVVQDLGYRIVTETWTKETTGVPLDLVTRLERVVTTVEDGLRFAHAAHTTTDNYNVIALPADLLTEANGIDREQTLSAIESLAVALTTDENGTRLAETVVLPESVDRADSVDELVRVLETKYAAVERDGDRIVASETTFSPARARELGVPEGPAFGRLSNGQDVEINGTVVSPSDVQEQQTYVFSTT